MVVATATDPGVSVEGLPRSNDLECVGGDVEAAAIAGAGSGVSVLLVQFEVVVLGVRPGVGSAANALARARASARTGAETPCVGRRAPNQFPMVRWPLARKRGPNYPVSAASVLTATSESSRTGSCDTAACQPQQAARPQSGLGSALLTDPTVGCVQGRRHL